MYYQDIGSTPLGPSTQKNDYMIQRLTQVPIGIQHTIKIFQNIEEKQNLFNKWC